MSDKQYRAQKAQELTGAIADQTAWIIDDDGGITSMYDPDLSAEQQFAVIAYVLAGDVLTLAQQVEQLTAEVELYRADLAAAQQRIAALEELVRE